MAEVVLVETVEQTLVEVEVHATSVIVRCSFIPFHIEILFHGVFVRRLLGLLAFLTVRSRGRFTILGLAAALVRFKSSLLELAQQEPV